MASEAYLEARPLSEVRGYIDAPTGSGKTVIFARLLQDLYAKDRQPRTIILEPTLQLVDQTYDALIAHGYKGVVRKLQGHKKEDGLGDVVVMTQMGFTVQCRDNNLWAIDPDQYGLIIADEAHHLQGDLTQKILNKRFEHAGVLGFTATPDYDEKRMLGNILPDNIHSITTQEAVMEGLISPYTTAMLLTRTDLSSVKVGPNEYVLSDLESALDTDVRNYAIARFFADNLGDHSALFNCSRITHAEHMAEALRLHGVRAMAVHGQMKRGEQRQILEALHSGELQAVTQARLLGEGFDEPNIDVIVNVSPTLSYVRAKQRAGRAQRINPENPEKFTLIVECIDSKYPRRPALYYDPQVSDNWQVFPDTMPQPTTELLARLGSYGFAGLSCLTTHDQALRWERAELGLLQGGQEYLTANLLDTTDYEAVSPLYIDPAKLATRQRQQPRRRSSDASLFDGYLEEPDFDEERYKDHELKTHTPQPTLSDRLGYQASEWVRSPVQEPGNPWLHYLLTGERPATKPDVMAAKRALIELAGSSELRNRGISERYTQLQYALSGNNDALFADTSEGWGGHTADRPVDVRFTGDAACADLDQDIFFPERGASTFAAKSLCHVCKVRRECLQMGIDFEEKHGILGGLSERQRRRVRRTIELGGNGEAMIQEMWRVDAERIDRQIRQKELQGVDWRN